MHKEIKKECFIKEIELKNIRYIDDFTIKLSDTERKHLLFTGKNGCGKTTTLIEINKLFEQLFNNEDRDKAYKRLEQEAMHKEMTGAPMNRYEMELFDLQCELRKTNDPNAIETININIEKKKKEMDILTASLKNIEKGVFYYRKKYDDLSKSEIIFNDKSNIYKDIKNGTFILAYFGDKRESNPIIPKGVQEIRLSKGLTTNTKSLNTLFFQYLINLRMKMLDAKEDNDIDEVEKIKFWFNRFENALKNLYDEEELVLKYNRTGMLYTIEYGIKSFGLNQLSSGYSSIIVIITELILRMEAHDINSYDLQGVVLIDEIETHLHVSLQKKILPFLTEFFPKIQFILTTHSPFVLSSLKNTVIYDLERMEQVEDLTAYSYDALIESYFDSDKYSQEIKNKIEDFEVLSKTSNKNESETEKYNNLKRYFKAVPTFMADELAVKINEILLNDLGKN